MPSLDPLADAAQDTSHLLQQEQCPPVPPSTPRAFPRAVFQLSGPHSTLELGVVLPRGKTLPFILFVELDEVPVSLQCLKGF